MFIHKKGEMDDIVTQMVPNGKRQTFETKNRKEKSRRYNNVYYHYLRREEPIGTYEDTTHPRWIKAVA